MFSCARVLSLMFSCARNLSGARFPTSSACRFTTTAVFPYIFFLLSHNFIIFCANFPFRLRLHLHLRLHQSTLPPVLIAFLFCRVLRSGPSIHQPLPSHRYDGPVQVPPTAAVSVEIVGDGENSAAFGGRSGSLLPYSSDASSSFSSESSVSSASSESSSLSPSLSPLSHSSVSEPPPP